MLADGRTVPDGEEIRADVCIIGAGPAGITLARELSAAKLEVILLERGSSDPGDARVPPDTVVNRGLRYPLEDTRSFGIGGSLHDWLVDTPVGGGMGRLRELDDDDFERRDWIPHSGWPFGKDHLRPFLSRARALFDASDAGTRSDDAWEAVDLPGAFNDDAGRIRTRIFAFGNPAVFAAEYRRQLENREDVLVLTNSVAAEVGTDGAAASGIRVVTDGPSYRVTARAYVLAAGGLETPRILLCSPAPGTRTIGNEHDLVGRFFMEHPHYVSGLLVPTDPGLFDDRQQYAVHMRDGVPVQRKYTLAEDVVRREGLPRCVFMLSPSERTARLKLLTFGDAGIVAVQRSIDLRERLRTEGLSFGAARSMTAALVGAPHVLRFTAAKAVTRAGRRFGWKRYVRPQVFKIGAMAEQIPNPDSRLVLTGDRDAYRLPVAALHWRLSGQDLDGLRRTQVLLGEALAGAGHEHVGSLLERRSLLPGLIGGCHHMGTTRMHDSPRQGVVDRNSRVHGVSNLYVAGSSVFPTVGYANPTLTLLALTLRLADHLRAELS